MRCARALGPSRTGPAALAVRFACAVALVLVAAPRAAAAFTPAAGSPVAAGHGPYALALSPSGALLASADYVGQDVSVFAVDRGSGALTPAPGSPFAVSGGPADLAFAPSGGLLATADAAGDAVSVFMVGASGGLTEVSGSPFATGAQPRSLAFSSDGKWLAVGDYGDATVAVYAVNSAGALTPAAGSPFPVPSEPRDLAFSPSGALLAVAGGASSLSLLAFDRSNGAVAPVAGSPFAAGSEPFAVAWSPDGAHLAVADRGGAAIAEFAVSSGGLTPVAGSPFATGSAPFDVAYSDDGSLLASANHGDGTLSVFSVDPSSGEPTPVAGSPLAAGSQPHAVLFGPGGGLLIGANAGDGTLSIFIKPPPAAAIGAPLNGGTWSQDVHETTSFSCSDATDGPGIASCTDSDGAAAPAGVLDTSTPGQHKYTVTAVSRDGLSATTSISYTVVAVPPSDSVPPAIIGTAVVGRTVTCSTGTWAPPATSYAYTWTRDGAVIAGAAGASHTVRTGDAGTTLACSVTASDDAGAGLASASAGVSVPAGCPPGPATVGSNALGPVRIGMAAADVAHLLHASRMVRLRGGVESFCLTPAPLQVGSSAGRVVWVTTAGAGYAVDGVKVGALASAAHAALRRGRHPARVVSDGHGSLLLGEAGRGGVVAVIETRNGRVVAVGLADARWLAAPRAARVLLGSL